MKHAVPLQDAIFTRNFDRDISEMRRKVREFGAVAGEACASSKSHKVGEHQSLMQSQRKIRAKVEKLVHHYTLNKCFLP